MSAHTFTFHATPAAREFDGRLGVVKKDGSYFCETCDAPTPELADANRKELLSALNSHADLVGALTISEQRLDREHARISQELSMCEDEITRSGLGRAVRLLHADLATIRSALAKAQATPGKP